MSGAETCHRCGRDRLHMPDNGNYCCCVSRAAPESLPSGVLKVAKECKLLMLAYAQAVLTCADRATDQHVKAVSVAESAMLAAIDQLAALASPPPQATLSEPLTVLQYNAIPELCAIKPSLYESIVRAIERAHGITAASQVEPEEKHG